MVRKSNLFYGVLLTTLLAFPGLSQVTKSDTVRVNLDEVTISAYRIPRIGRQFASITTLISRKEIENSTARNLAELLKSLPDVDVRQRGPAGVQADISLRGGTFDQVAILINGINFTDPQTGHFQMDIPIPLNLIQRIEVLSGGDVKSLGSNAFTGAINIITGVPEAKRLHAGISVGQYGYLEAGIDGALHKGHWWNQSGVLFQKSDGYRENTDFNNLNGFIQTGYSLHKLNLSVMAGGLKKAFGANSFYTAKFPNQFEVTGTGFAALQATWSGKINAAHSFYYRLHSDEFSLFRTDPPTWYLSPNYHLSQIAGSKTDAWITTQLGKTALGFEFRHENIWSTVLGEQVTTPKNISGVSGVQYSRFGSRNHFSLSVEQQMVTGRFSWNAGVVFHQVKSVKNYFQVYPGIDISYRASSAIKAFISFNRAFRLPTFTELYYKSPTNLGSAALLPETAWHTEAGLDFRKTGFSFRLSGFHRFASQSIDWVRTESETIWHAENLGKIRTFGFESGVSYSPVRQSGLIGAIDRLNLGYRYYFQHHSVDSWYSQYVLDYLKWKMTAGLSLKVGKPFRFSVNLVWQERNGTYTAFGAGNSITEVDYKPFMVMDVKALYRVKWVAFTVECSNIFNQEYFDLSSIPLPGAWYRAGIEINLVGMR